MANIIMRILAIFAAVQLATDLIGLVVNPFPIDPTAKTWILTIVFGLTLAWDIAGIVVFSAVPGLPAVWTERRRRVAIYFATLAAAFTVLALVLVWTPLGLSYLLLTIGVEIFLLLITATDVASAAQILR